MTIYEVEASKQKIGQKYVITKLSDGMLPGTRGLSIGDVVEFVNLIDVDGYMYAYYRIPSSPLCLSGDLEVEELK